MSLELYFVPPGNRDFRKTVVEKAVEGMRGPDYSAILYMAPTHHMLRTWQRDFHPHGGQCYVPPRLRSLSRLSKELFSGSGRGRLLSKSLVPIVISGLSGCGMGHATLVAKFISEMKHFFPHDDIPSLRQRLAGLFEELGILEEASRGAFEALDMFEKYKGALDSKGFVDEDDALILSAETAREAAGPEVLVLDGFYEVTPAEFLLIRSLIEKAARTIVSVPVSGPDDDLTYCYSHFIEECFDVRAVTLPPGDAAAGLRYYPAASREEELEAIARHIKSSFVSGRLEELQDVYVSFPELSQYRAMAERVMRRYGVPFNIATAAPLSSKRPYTDILSLLEAVSDDFPRLATARVLTSPHFRSIPGTVRNAVPAIALDAGTIRGRAAWLGALSEAGAEEEGRDLLDRLSALILPDNKATYSVFIDALLKVLGSLGFTPDDGAPEQYEALFRRFREVGEVIDTRVGLAEFTDALRRVLDYHMDDAPEKPGVQVAELTEIRGLEPARLYMGGLKDGDLPARPEMDFILPDSVRSRLGLVDMHRHLKLQGYIFRRLVAAAGSLRLSYPRMEGDKLFIPSLYLREGREAVEKIFGAFSPEEDLTRRPGAPLSEQFGEVTGIRRFRKGSPIRVTDIDAYRACPRRFYIEKVLGLQPPEVREYEIDPMVQGSIMHEVMERLIGPGPGTLEEFTARAGRVLDGVLGRWELEPYFRGLLRETFMNLVPAIHELEESIAQEGYCTYRSEYPLAGEPLPGIRLKGKVDRIDMKDGSALVLDYKTGGAALSSTRTLKEGATLQPFLYAAMLKAEGLRPESVGIYSLKDVRLQRIPAAKDVREGRTLDEFIETCLWYLDATVDSMWGGDFSARPLGEATCRQCHERPYCPYIHGDAHGG